MGKIKPLSLDDPSAEYFTVLVHVGNPSRTGPYNNYHTAWGYHGLEPGFPPFVDAWQTAASRSEAMARAQVWAANPHWMADICLTCRFYDRGPSLIRPSLNVPPPPPRWYPQWQDKPLPTPCCFVQRFIDDPPPWWVP